LLLECLRPSPTPSAIGSAIESSAAESDLDRCVEAARWHGVSPLVYSALDGLGLDEGPCAKLRASLRRDFDLNAMHTARLAMELVHVAALLDERAIPYVASKGAVVGALAYRSPWLRQFSDVDVMTSPERAVEVRRALGEIGYEPMLPLSPVQEARHVRGSPFAYSFSLARPGAEMAIDLHWSPAERGHPAFPRRLDAPWDRSIECALSNGSVRTFSPEDTVLYLSAHAAKHGWERLRWITDVVWLLNAQDGLDWDDVLQTAAERGPIGERTLLVTLRLAERLFAGSLPPEALGIRRDDEIVESIVDDVIPELERASDEWPLHWPRSFQSDAFFIRMAETPVRRAAYFLRHCALRVAAPDAKDRAAPSLPGPLSFLYWILRPTRLLREYGWGPVRTFFGLLPRLIRGA